MKINLTDQEKINDLIDNWKIVASFYKSEDEYEDKYENGWNDWSYYFGKEQGGDNKYNCHSLNRFHLFGFYLFEHKYLGEDTISYIVSKKK